MQGPDLNFDPYTQLGPGPEPSDLEFLKRELRLTTPWPDLEHEHPDWDLLFRNPSRTPEFAEYYFSHPDLPPWTRFTLAELLVTSAADFIDPNPIDDPSLVPVPDDAAIPLIARLVNDTMTRFCLAGIVQHTHTGTRLSRLAREASGSPLRNVYWKK